MRFCTIKQLIIAALFCLAAIAAAVFVLFDINKEEGFKDIPPQPQKTETIDTPARIEISSEPRQEIIGSSVQNRKIESYIFGTGHNLLVFIGGIHGGYEWNSVLLAYEFIDYLQANPKLIPENLSIAVIPALNPDGLFKATGKAGRFVAGDVAAGTNEAGRFNANNVDLNRNFACNWQARSVWRQKEVSAGAAAFSEPESAAIRDYVLQNNPAAVVFWHSRSNAVYGSMCNGDMAPETRAILNAYAKASGYPAKDTFDQYQVSGDATDWLASIGIPAITVELSTHESVEWSKNWKGIQSLLEYYAKK